MVDCGKTMVWLVKSTWIITEKYFWKICVCVCRMYVGNMLCHGGCVCMCTYACVCMCSMHVGSMLCHGGYMENRCQSWMLVPLPFTLYETVFALYSFVLLFEVYTMPAGCSFWGVSCLHLLSCRAGIVDVCHHSWGYMNAGTLKSGPCTICASPTEPYSQPL